MARKLHQAISDENHTYAVVETAASSGGRQWGNYVNLSTVKLENADADQLTARRILGNSKIEVLESWEVDSANQGPRSGYGKTLKAMLEELPGHVQGEVLHNTGVLSPDGSTKEFGPAIEAIKKVPVRDALTKIAETSRPPQAQDEDLATPEQALAARQAKYGRGM